MKSARYSNTGRVIRFLYKLWYRWLYETPVYGFMFWWYSETVDEVPLLFDADDEETASFLSSNFFLFAYGSATSILRLDIFSAALDSK